MIASQNSHNQNRFENKLIATAKSNEALQEKADIYNVLRILISSNYFQSLLQIDKEERIKSRSMVVDIWNSEHHSYMNDLKNQAMEEKEEKMVTIYCLLHFIL